MYKVIEEYRLDGMLPPVATDIKVRTTTSQREANNKQWYKEFVDRCGGIATSTADWRIRGYDINGGYGINDFRRMIVNYDLFNNILHKEDFTYVFRPYGNEVGELPAELSNKDIISAKIKALLSMERARPFDWHIVCTNPEATTRKEQQEKQMHLQYVIQQIMQPIQEQVIQQYQQQLQELQLQQQQLQQEYQNIMQEVQQYEQELQEYNNQQQQQQQQDEQQQDEQNIDVQAILNATQSDGTTPEEQNQVDDKPQIPARIGQQEDIQNQIKANEEAQQNLQQQIQQIQQQIQQEIETLTPYEVKKYMQRQYQDPAEILCAQLLQYIIHKENIKEKFNEGFKHGLIAGRTIFWTGILNTQPVLRVVNPLGFRYDVSSMLQRIEDGEWASYEQYMSPTDIITAFGDELTEEEIDKIYNSYNSYANNSGIGVGYDNYYNNNYKCNGVRVVHCEWKALKKIKFVTGIDIETGTPYEAIVDESYTINKMAGDTEVKVLWIPTKFEGYKIASDIYVYMREVPGQHKDLDNLYECKLSYIGNSYDNTNSAATSLIDRMKYYQYLYNIIWYRIELLTAKDDGKKILLDASVINSSSQLDVKQWLHTWKASNLGIVNGAEEGNKGFPPNVGALVSQLDMSMSGDIQRYIQLAQYIEQMCSANIGFTQQYIENVEQIENKIDKPYHSNILDSYFHIHRDIKCRVLQALVENMKVAYSTYQPEKISYILDDVSVDMLNPDYDMLDNNTYGIFITDNPKIDTMLDTIKTLSQAALQNQRVELSDVIKIMNTNDLEEAQELLATAEEELRKRTEQQQQQQQQQEQMEIQSKIQMQQKEHEFRMEFMMKQEQLRTERELQKQAMLSVGFNEDKDIDDDGQLDVLEIYKGAKAVDIKESKLQLEKEKLQQRKKEHNDNISIKNKELSFKNTIKKRNMKS